MERRCELSRAGTTLTKRAEHPHLLTKQDPDFLIRTVGDVHEFLIRRERQVGDSSTATGRLRNEDFFQETAILAKDLKPAVAAIADIHETVAIDPSSGLALSVPTRDGLGNYRNDLVVTDTATGTIVHSIEKARATSLGLTVQALLDDKIWVTTTDQKLVLSARTGDVVESGWTGYPLVANDSGVMYSDGRFVERA